MVGYKGHCMHNGKVSDMYMYTIDIIYVGIM